MTNNSVLGLYFPSPDIVRGRLQDILTMSISKYIDMLSKIPESDKRRQITDYRLCSGSGIVSDMWNPLSEKMMFGGIQNNPYCLLFETDVIGQMLHEGLVKTKDASEVISLMTRKYIEKYGVLTGEQTDWMSAIQSSTDRCVSQLLSQFPLAPW